jgi:FAD/FMN-containing dehydrogenase
MNFGGNVRIEAARFYEPRSEAEVLAILKENVGRRIRTVGRLHSWSEAAVGDDVVLDLRHLNRVQTEIRDGRVWATVGGGTQIKRILSELLKQQGVTTPSLGLITEQSIAGAISTGTHGSGRHSLSHYMDEIRVAVFDPTTGEPTIRTLSQGDALRAARCSLGCTGVILSVSFWCRPDYLIEEHWAWHDTLESVLTCEVSEPLQQFYLIPWNWRYCGQHRRETDQPRSRLAGLYRLYCFLNLDLLFHLFVLLLTRVIRSAWLVRLFFRSILPRTILTRTRMRDRAADMLIMEHELFRHLEMELFVKRSDLPGAMTRVEALLRYADGDRSALTSDFQRTVEGRLSPEDVERLCGSYTYAYPVCVRRILPDDTLLSMESSDDEPYYSISFITYLSPNRREPFFRFATAVYHLLLTDCRARPHWGKWSPIQVKEVRSLYPHLNRFRAICEELDPRGAFRNRLTDDLLFQDAVSPPPPLES